MIRAIALGIFSLIVLPLFLVASPYFLYRYWIPNAITLEGSGYRGAWATYKENMKEILFEELR